MDVSRRDFLALAAVLGAGVGSGSGLLAASGNPENITASDIMDFKPTGKATLLHICDMHAHLRPLYWREPSTLISAKELVGTPGFICGERFSKYYGLNTKLDRYFDTYVDFEPLARKFGKMGGIAHMKTIIDEVRRDRGRDNVLLLDSGDTWQGTAVALKTGGEAIVKAQNLLGVDVMVPHWEFTYGKERVMELIELFKGEFISQNVIDNDPMSDSFEELIFNPYTIKEVGGAKIGIIGQAFPFSATAHPRHLTEGWSFGVRTDTLQGYVDELRSDKKVDCIVVLSHDGFSVDQEVARRVKGIDFILSGHTHDPAPRPIVVNGTVIVIAGSHGKYIGRLDIDARGGKVHGYTYKLIPVASNLIKADAAAARFVEDMYAPYKKELDAKLCKTEGLLYKRDTFHSTFDALIGEAIRNETDADIVFTPGYRWGTTLLPGDDILMDNVYEMSAITYPEVYTLDLKGHTILQLLEDISDNVFNPDPMLQQGGDMSRLFNATYDITVGNGYGKRISNFKIGGKAIDPSKTYAVSTWGGNLQNHPDGANLREKKRAVYDIAGDYLRGRSKVSVPMESNVRVTDMGCGCPDLKGKC